MHHVKIGSILFGINIVNTQCAIHFNIFKLHPIPVFQPCVVDFSANLYLCLTFIIFRCSFSFINFWTSPLYQPHHSSLSETLTSVSLVGISQRQPSVWLDETSHMAIFIIGSTIACIIESTPMVWPFDFRWLFTIKIMRLEQFFSHTKARNQFYIIFWGKKLSDILSDELEEYTG